jgi:hypothetical protein
MEFLPAPSIIAVLKKKSCNIVLDEVVDCDCKQTFANKKKKKKVSHLQTYVLGWKDTGIKL